MLLSLRSLPFILLLPALILAPLRAQTRTLSFTNSRAEVPPTMEDYYAGFSLRYPENWTKASDPVKSGSFFRAFTTVRTGEHAGMISEQFSIGPLIVPAQANDSLTMLMVMAEARRFEDRSFGDMSGFRHTYSGTTTVDGITAYEIRNEGAGGAELFSNTKAYGRFLFVLPTATSEGVLIGLSASSFTPGISGPDDLGASGAMAEILRSLKISRHAAVAPSTPVRFTAGREKIAPQYQLYYTPFSFERPRSWGLFTAVLDPGSFVTVRRAVLRNDVPEFTTDLFSVKPLPIFAPSDNADTAEVRRTFNAVVDTIAAQMPKNWKSYEQTSLRRVTFNGHDAAEIRFKATLPSPNAEGVNYYGCFMIVAPTKSEKGCVIVMQGSSLSTGLHGPDEVGKVGDLGAVLRSFRFGR